MTEQRLSERSIFEAAIERGSPEERAAYLDRACGSDGGLRKEVEALLAAHDRLGRMYPVATSYEPPLSERPGTAVGPYKLLEQIGEGGMGTVWMVQQTEPVKRLVALKLIKAGMDSELVIARWVPLHVLGEAVGRLVTPVSVLFQRLHHDPVQLATQQAGQLRRLHPSVRGQGRQALRRAQLDA
jgi:hypothetical protein